MNLEFNKRVILTWSFWTWKSTLINKLNSLWFPVIFENSRRVLTELWVSNIELQGKKLEEFQRKLINIQIEEERKKSSFITDTSLIENLAYSINLQCFNKLEDLVKSELKNYDYIFLCPLLDFLEDDKIRYTDRKYQQEIEKNIRYFYQKYNYQIIELPIIGKTFEEQVENKLKYILQKIKE